MMSMKCVPVLSTLLLVFLPVAATDATAPARLDVDLDRSVTLELRETTVGEVYEALGAMVGLQFDFHPKLDTRKPTAVSLSEVPLRTALKAVTKKFDHFYVTRPAGRLFVADNTRANRQQYLPQVIRTFHLSNADTQETVTLLRSLLQARQIVELPRLNAVSLKEYAGTVDVAARLIESADRAGGEVSVEFELLEVSSALGARLAEELRESASSTVRGANRAELARRVRTSPEAENLAHPRLTIVNGERGSIFLGDAIPLPAGECGPATAAQDAPCAPSVSYQDVGVAIEATPRVHDDRDITIELAVGVSSVSSEDAAVPAEVRGPVITRSRFETTMRVEDGDTQIVTGLTPSRRAGSTKGETTELILLVTTRVTRMPDIRSEDRLPVWVGTEEEMGLEGPPMDAASGAIARRSD